ncbi:MAG: type II toxin-antitoxin system prevent-host-death family antitoxin [bacterium]|jgi:prevent-host-death family protein
MAKRVQNQRVEVGVRELKSKLSHYIDLVQHGSEVIVTEHGKPVATLAAINDLTNKLEDLVASGRLRPPIRPKNSIRNKEYVARTSVSDIVVGERR